MQYYFCYSSALDQSSLDQWKNQHGYAHFQLPMGEIATATDVKLVCDFPSRFWGGRVLSLEPEKGASVLGVLFGIEHDSDWQIIAHKEGKMTGVSSEMQVKVRLAGQGPELSTALIDATTFVTHPLKKSLDGPISKNFISALARAYQHWGLPTAPLDLLSKDVQIF